METVYAAASAREKHKTTGMSAQQQREEKRREEKRREEKRREEKRREEQNRTEQNRMAKTRAPPALTHTHMPFFFNKIHGPGRTCRRGFRVNVMEAKGVESMRRWPVSEASCDRIREEKEAQAEAGAKQEPAKPNQNKTKQQPKQQQQQTPTTEPGPVATAR